MIPFNKPLFLGNEIEYMKRAATVNHKIAGDGPFTKACTDWLQKKTGACGAFLTSSGTHALEMAALLCNIKPGDEVIMSAFTFVSTANAFALRGAKIIFTDIRPDTMNIDENLIEAAITKNTRVIVPMHYGGIACEMESIMEVAKNNRLLVVEDAAQGIMATYKNKELGSIGDFGCYSFHETKNFTMGEGGGLLISEDCFMKKAGIVRDKGTNRQDFLNQEVDFYSWVDLGSSYLPSELNAAYLYAQLEVAEMIQKQRLALWNKYYQYLKPLEDAGYINLPTVPREVTHNGHLFYIKVENVTVREDLIDWLKKNNIIAVFHYVPLHTTPAGKKFGEFSGNDIYTTRESQRLLRLPLYYDLSETDLVKVCEQIEAFFKCRK
ncbi:dTDP-4-amino-4,6-dideoxygalactose transaminase [Eubacteriaceae bacterium ES3]|nr:dTDP-4-amino-4,6-dideoxygalactose transaminase [Eubacteriaceae bacterium ES3]